MSYPSTKVAFVDQGNEKPYYPQWKISESGTRFLQMLIHALAVGVAIVDEGPHLGPASPNVIGHCLKDWQSFPLYPEPAYRVAQQVAHARGLALAQPEQIWADLEQAGFLTRAWDGRPLIVHWRDSEIAAFIVPLVVLGLKPFEKA